MCRRLAYSVCFVLTLSLSVHSEGATMVAHWRLDNDATDSVGGINGTLINGPEFTTDAMVGSHALALDSAASQYVDFGNPPKLPAGRSPRSMAGWGKTSTVAGGWRWIAAYGSAGTSLAMFIGMNGTSLYGGGYGDDVSEPGFWEVDVWHHICLTPAAGHRAGLTPSGHAARGPAGRQLQRISKINILRRRTVQDQGMTAYHGVRRELGTVYERPTDVTD